MPQLFAEYDEIISGDLGGRVLNSFHERKGGETSTLDLSQVERGRRPTEVRNTDFDRLSQGMMAFDRGRLL